jgi:hypothetical protein
MPQSYAERAKMHNLGLQRRLASSLDTRMSCQSRQGFEVASEPPQPYFDNVRFLAGYRRAESNSAVALGESTRAAATWNVFLPTRSVLPAVPRPLPGVRVVSSSLPMVMGASAGLRDRYGWRPQQTGSHFTVRRMPQRSTGFVHSPHDARMEWG